MTATFDLFSSFCTLPFSSHVHHTSPSVHLTPHDSDYLITNILTSKMEDMKQFLKPPVKEQIRLLVVRPFFDVSHIRQ